MPPDQIRRLVAKCSLCAKLLKWVPVAFIVTIITWSYYAYVVQLCFLTVESLIETVCYLLLYHAAFGMFVWSYWQTIFTPIGSVPQHFTLHPHEAELIEAEQNEENQRQLLENFARDLPVACRTENGAIRYCEKCRSIKPDRAHHCSICGTCVLKMDHHCPWINNCVCFTNYKFFVLFLGYGLLYCFLIFATTTQYFVQFWTHELENQGRYHIVFLFFVSVMFGISLISLFGYHSYLVLVNRSTLESFRPPIFKTGPNKLGFNLGWHANFIQVFGENRNKWFLPVNSSSGDGVIYPERQANPVNAEAFVY